MRVPCSLTSRKSRKRRSEMRPYASMRLAYSDAVFAPDFAVEMASSGFQGTRDSGVAIRQLAALLAAGYLRHRIRASLQNLSKFSHLDKVPLDFSADQSVSVESSHDGDAI